MLKNKGSWVIKKTFLGTAKSRFQKGLRITGLHRSNTIGCTKNTTQLFCIFASFQGDSLKNH